MKQAHVYISGFVQGVGFRNFVKKEACKLNLTGWVKNLPDNRVEALFQGQEETLNKMIKICKKGSFLSEVDDIEVIWEENGERLTSFDILH